MRLAVIGDLVFGMASYAPPVPFVGEIGDEAAEAAERMTRGLEQSQGNKAKAPLVVTINGQPAATQNVVAIEMGPGGDTALPIAWQPKISIGQKHSLLHEGMFQVGSGGSLNSSAARQQVVTAPPAPKGEQSEQGAAPASSANSRGARSRSDYAPPSAMQTMLSHCSSARTADLAPPKYACLVGDPVDVATGAVVTDATDYRSVAPPLAFTRHYASNRSDVDSPFGFGWSHNFDQAVWLEVGRVVVRDEHGRQIEFDCVPLRDGVARAGDELLDPTGRIRLRCHGRHHWELLDSSQILHFGPIPGTASSDTDRGLARLTKVIVPGQPLTELSYDVHARLHRIAVDGKAVIELRYDQDDHVQALNRDAARFSYSLNGDLAEAFDAAGSARSYEYAGHLLVRETNRRGGSFYYGYDGHGAAARCIRTWGVGGRLHRVLAYDSDTTTVTDSLGHTTLYERSAVGLVSRIVDPHGDATTYKYNDALQLTVVGLPDGTSLRDDYDDEGRLICQRRPGGQTWKMTYDTAGHLVRGIDPIGGQWHFTYDFAGQLSRVQDPEGHVTRLEYETGQLCRIIDPLGVVTSVQLGRGKEVTQLVLPGNIGVQFEHDGRGRLARTRSHAHGDGRWSYDSNGRPTGYQSERGSLRLDRDAEGSIVGVEQGRRTWSVRRDLFGLTTGLSDGTRELSYDYDSEGRLARAVADGKTRWEVRRDERGLIQATTLDDTRDCSISRQPNSGHITRMQWPDRRITIDRDESGRISEVVDGDDTRTFSYRQDGRLTEFALGERRSKLTRNALGVVIEQDHNETVVRSAHTDHSGKRYGLALDGTVSVSYLRTDDGQLERIAVTAGKTFDLSITHSGEKLEVLHQGEHVVVDTAERPAKGAATDDLGPSDALFRPRSAAGGEPLLWDEDRVLLRGEAIHITDPQSGRHLATVLDETLSLQDPGATRAVGLAPSSPEQRAYEASFPRLFELQGPLPLALLRNVFRPRTWDPAVRPVAGTHPWDPQAWVPDQDTLPAPDTRLDQTALLRLLSPFPRDALSLQG